GVEYVNSPPTPEPSPTKTPKVTKTPSSTETPTASGDTPDLSLTQTVEVPEPTATECDPDVEDCDPPVECDPDIENCDSPFAGLSPDNPNGTPPVAAIRISNRH